MANPQLENGHTKIANELMEALCKFRIPGEQRLVFDCIIRYTYGWHKKNDTIALSQFVSMTGLKKPNVVRAIASLVEHSVIKHDNDSYSINKDYEQWQQFTYRHVKIPTVIKHDNKPLSNMITKIIKHDNKPLSNMIPSKERKALSKAYKEKSTNIITNVIMSKSS